MEALPAPAKSAPRARHRKTFNAQRLMIGVAAAGLIALAIFNDVVADGSRGSLWRVFVTIAAFLFLWRLGSLLFDLVFVWHRYIHHDAALKFLRERVQRQDLSPTGDSSKGEAHERK